MSEQTRLRFIIVKDEVQGELAINSLPFMVELKFHSLPKDGRGMVLWFVIPEPEEFISVDLRKKPNGANTSKRN